MTTPIGIDSVLSQIRQMRQQTSMPGNLGMPAPIAPPRPVDPSGPASGPEPVSFGGLIRQAADSVNAVQKAGAANVTSFEMGGPVSLTEVMVSLQKADVSFKAMVEVRNKMVEAYQDIMRMSV